MPISDYYKSLRERWRRHYVPRLDDCVAYIRAVRAAMS